MNRNLAFACPVTVNLQNIFYLKYDLNQLEYTCSRKVFTFYGQTPFNFFLSFFFFLSLGRMIFIQVLALSQTLLSKFECTCARPETTMSDIIFYLNKMPYFESWMTFVVQCALFLAECRC